jgi:hypothetical protein
VSELTDEQVAEGLRAKDIVTRWASWIEEVSQEMEPDAEGSARLVRDRAFLESILERLQAAEAESAKRLTAIHHAAAEALEATRRASVAEAERDEARKERDASVLHARGLCRQLDETQEERDTYERLHASARQQARREAFEEAAKEADNLVRLLRKGAWPGARYSHDDGADDVEEFADAIRALAEVER